MKKLHKNPRVLILIVFAISAIFGIMATQNRLFFGIHVISIACLFLLVAIHFKIIDFKKFK